jgi:hypothetical protein
MEATTVVGATPAAPEGTTTKPERQVGPETRAVRIFREVFAQDAAAARHLKPSLDRYLKLVLEDPTAKRGDKTYARKIYADLLRIFGGGEPQALPDWAKPKEALSDQDIQDILQAADDPPPLIPAGMSIETSGVTITGPVSLGGPLVVRDVPAGVSTVIPELGAGMDLDPLDGLLEPEPPDLIEEQCKKYLAELMASNELPFVRVFDLGPNEIMGIKGTMVQGGFLPAGAQIPTPLGRFVALGTVLGTVTHGKHQGKKVNIHCTIAGYRRLRDAEKDHFVYVKGRPLVVSGDDPKTGLRKHIFCVKHTAGLKIRYWTRINDKDEEGRARFFVLTGDGVRGITREQF